MTGPKGAIRCGERSLETYCAAVVLSLLANLYLIKVSDGIAAQFVVSAAGIAALTLFATSITWISKRSRQHPKLLQRKAGRIAQSPIHSEPRQILLEAARAASRIGFVFSK